MSYIRLKEFGPLQRGYIEAIGRALLVCQHLEGITHHVAVTWQITDALREQELSLNQIEEIATKLDSVRLVGFEARLRRSNEFPEDHKAALVLGRDARNWIAHEAAIYADLPVSSQLLMDSIRQFIRNVRNLCHADSLMSQASYEICERAPAPINLQENYDMQ
ncbi:MAG: hypothetical protein GF341_09120, partial [candidate division Zixibacteria bacterium]|nr:hypothetical protein [candidate division Zixibacteria bacterium]